MSDLEPDDPVVYRLAEISGFEFEDAVCTVFERLGYDAQVAERVADLGRDVIARSSEETLVVECKHTSSSVGRPVVQKLHSAAVSFEDGARGIIVSSGGFSRPAREHADQLGHVVELWDLARLTEHARDVEVYFQVDDESGGWVFRTSFREVSETRTRFERSFVESLESAPRAVDDAIDLEARRGSVLPAILVEYELDETYGTSTYPRLHRAHEEGRTLLPVESDLSPTERRLWRDATFAQRCESSIDGRPPEAYFGVDPGAYEQKVSRRLARQHSTTVTYRGDNNQTYEKTFEVDPDDVSTRSRRVLLRRHRIRIDAGPARHAFDVAARQGAPPAIVQSETIPVERGIGIQKEETGLLCNDCGTIRSSAASPAPARCVACSRTVCADHYWPYPSALLSGGTPYCSRCYPDARAVPDFPFDSGIGTFLSALVPPLPLALAGRWGAVAAFSALASLAAAGMANDAVRTGLGTAGPIVLAVLGLAAIVWMHVWARRSRRHRANLDELAGYRPDWEREGTASDRSSKEDAAG
ncbi:MAG: restriction endonuclease [Bradymonadaceae bacterium]